MAERKEVEALVQSAIGRSEDRRLQELARARERNEDRALSSGAYTIGRDERGAPVGTMMPLLLGMKVNGWRVRMSFKRDDRKKLKEMSWRDIEAAVKGGSSPTRIVETENHILAAMRELNHILEGYQEEVTARLDRNLSPIHALIRLNMDIHLKNADASDDDIRNVVSAIESLRKQLNAKHSPIAGIIAPAKLNEAIAKFNKVLEGNPNKRAFLVGTACAVLISVPDNLTKWRDKRIAAAVSKTSCRVVSLRVERDKWVFSQLANYCNNTSRVSDFVELDNRKKGVLVRADGMIDEMMRLGKSITGYRKKCLWTAENEKELQAAKSSFEAMKSEAMRLPWHDKAARQPLRKEIQRLVRKKHRSEEDEKSLEEKKKTLERMKSEAMKCPWADASKRDGLSMTIRRLQKKKDAAAANLEPLTDARKAYREKNEEAVRCLDENAAIFYPGHVKPSTLYGDYGWIRRYVKSHKLPEARRKIADFLLFLNSNKPRYILDELSKSPEPYLEAVLTELKTAVEAFEAHDIKTAKKHFAFASLEMRAIAFPERR